MKMLVKYEGARAKLIKAGVIPRLVQLTAVEDEGILVQVRME